MSDGSKPTDGGSPEMGNGVARGGYPAMGNDLPDAIALYIPQVSRRPFIKVMAAMKKARSLARKAKKTSSRLSYLYGQARDARKSALGMAEIFRDQVDRMSEEVVEEADEMELEMTAMDAMEEAGAMHRELCRKHGSQPTLQRDGRIV